MTIHYSELEDKFWVRDGDDVRWFESSLEAKDALRAIEVRQAIAEEVALIAAHFRKAGLTQVAMSIEAGDYKK